MSKEEKGILCLCPHEDCGVEFEHLGSFKETTACPECGRQQMPHPVHVDDQGKFIIIKFGDAK